MRKIKIQAKTTIPYKEGYVRCMSIKIKTRCCWGSAEISEWYQQKNECKGIRTSERMENDEYIYYFDSW
jgi:hypothetical protein